MLYTLDDDGGIQKELRKSGGEQDSGERELNLKQNFLKKFK